MATNIQRHNHHYTGYGVPEVQDFSAFKLASNVTYRDLSTASAMYKYNKTRGWEPTTDIYDGFGTGGVGQDGEDGLSAYEIAVENGFEGTESEWLDSLKGTDGTPATVTVKSVTTNTLPAGQAARVSVIDSNSNSSVAELNFTFDIPQGQAGSGGGTVVSDGYLVVRGNGTDDTTAFQAAVDANRTNNKKILLVGNIKTTKDITVAWDAWHLTIEGYGAVWNLGNGVTTGLKRVTPTDMNQATSMTTARHHITGVEIVGTTSQTGIDLGPSYGAVYRDLKLKGLKKGLWIQFGLNTTVDNVEVNQCVDGIIVDILHITGATASNSQSNQTTLTHCRAYGRVDGSSNVAFGFYGSSGCGIYHCIGEGGSHNHIVDQDYLASANVKDFEIKDLHLEAPSRDSFVNIRLTGSAEVNGLYSQAPGILISGSTAGGQVTIGVKGVVWQVPLNGKAIRNDGGARFEFSENSFQSGFTNPSTITQYFTGIAMSECKNGTCPGNTYQVLNAPNTTAARVSAAKTITATLTHKKWTDNIQVIPFETIEQAEYFCEQNKDTYDFVIDNPLNS